jgi:hypothetical protein
MPRTTTTTTTTKQSLEPVELRSWLKINELIPNSKNSDELIPVSKKK